MRSRILVAAIAALALLGTPGVASADDPIYDPTVDIVDPVEATMAEGVDPETVPGLAVADCWDEIGDHADVTVGYLLFEDDAVEHNLLLDVYLPDSRVAPPYTPAVMVHGGGWINGCRKWNDGMAFHMAEQGFLVFNIDYRMGCDDPNLYLCGYPFPTPAEDVKAAVSWVRDHAADYVDPEDLTDAVVGVGTSAGGNLIYEAAVTGIEGDSRPDVVAGGSGHPEMGYMSPIGQTTYAACERSDDPDQCWVGSTGYMGFDLDDSRDWCGDGGGDNWSEASPACLVTEDAPPTFIANATRELSALQAATDFQNALTTNGQFNVEFCTVGDAQPPSGADSHYHGTELFSPNLNPAPECNETSEFPFDRMIDFILANLP